MAESSASKQGFLLHSHDPYCEWSGQGKEKCRAVSGLSSVPQTPTVPLHYAPTNARPRPRERRQSECELTYRSLAGGA